eukprot:g20561.t1
MALCFSVHGASKVIKRPGDAKSSKNEQDLLYGHRLISATLTPAALTPSVPVNLWTISSDFAMQILLKMSSWSTRAALGGNGDFLHKLGGLQLDKLAPRFLLWRETTPQHFDSPGGFFRAQEYKNGCVSLASPKKSIQGEAAPAAVNATREQASARQARRISLQDRETEQHQQHQPHQHHQQRGKERGHRDSEAETSTRCCFNTTCTSPSCSMRSCLGKMIIWSAGLGCILRGKSWIARTAFLPPTLQFPGRQAAAADDDDDDDESLMGWLYPADSPQWESSLSEYHSSFVGRQNRLYMDNALFMFSSTIQLEEQQNSTCSVTAPATSDRVRLKC